MKNNDEQEQTNVSSVLNYQKDNYQYRTQIQYLNQFALCLSNKECIVSNEQESCDQNCIRQTNWRIQQCQQTNITVNESTYQYFFCNNDKLSSFKYKTDICQLINYETNQIHNFLCDLAHCMSNGSCQTYINKLNCSRNCLNGRCVDAIMDDVEMYYCDTNVNTALQNIDYVGAGIVCLVILGITLFGIFYYVCKTMPQKRRSKLTNRMAQQPNFQTMPSTATSGKLEYKNLLH